MFREASGCWRENSVGVVFLLMTALSSFESSQETVGAIVLLRNLAPVSREASRTGPIAG